MFGLTLLTSDILQVGNQYTFTFESGEWFFFDTTGEIQAGLNERMANIGQVTSVVRGLFSDRYVVTVIPTDFVTLNTWLMAFDASWKDMGYDNIIFIASEGGTVSTHPGGIAQVVPQIGEVAASTLKPLIPYAIVFMGIYLAITLLPTLTATKRRSYR